MTRKTARHGRAEAGDPRWAAVVARDPRADGEFVYAVVTTGIYCRPSCGARTARPENVRFFGRAEEAERAGFRPCRRCRPELQEKPEAALAVSLCRLIDESEEIPDLLCLARSVGKSVSSVRRLFKKATGLTPREYAAGRRAGRVRGELARRGSVTEAIYGAGYGSSGRFYEEADGLLGMTPSAFRAGGAGAEIRFAIGECSLGSILVALSGRGVCAIALGDDPGQLARELRDRFPEARLVGGDSDFELYIARVVALVEAPGLGLDLPLDIRGTAFQRRVWQELRRIPAGTTISYAELAERLGEPRAIRAVAGACAANRLAVAIPCHRVVNKDGRLSGYRWGVERKAGLLDREKRGVVRDQEGADGSGKNSPGRCGATTDAPSGKSPSSRAVAELAELLGETK